MPDGIAITELGLLHQLVATWDVYVTLDAPEFPTSLVDQIPRLNDTLTALSKLSRPGLPFDLQTHTFRVARLEAQLASLGPSRRPKRGLIDAGGSLLHAIFGVATSSQVRRLQAALADVSGSQLAITHSMQQLATVVNQTRIFGNKLAIQQYHLSSQLIHIKVTIGKLSTITQNHEGRITRLELLADFERYLDVLELTMDSFLSEQQKFDRQRNELALGHLSRDLLSTEDLQQILTAAATVHHIVKDLDWYYLHLSVKPMSTQQGILVYHLQIPLINPKTYLLYNILAHPVPVANTSMALMVNLEPQYALNTADGFIFAASNCVGSAPAICQPAPEFNEQRMACPRGLLTNRQELLASCKLTITHHADDIPFIKPINLNQFALTSFGEHLVIRCPSSPEQHIIIAKGVFNLTCLRPCSIHGSSWRLNCIDRLYVQQHIMTPPVLVPGNLNLSAIFATDSVMNVLRGIERDMADPQKSQGLELAQLLKPIIIPSIHPYQLDHHSAISILFGTMIVILIIAAALLTWRFRRHLRRYALHRRTNELTSIPMLERNSTVPDAPASPSAPPNEPGPTTRLWPILPSMQDCCKSTDQVNKGPIISTLASPEKLDP